MKEPVTYRVVTNHIQFMGGFEFAHREIASGLTKTQAFIVVQKWASDHHEGSMYGLSANLMNCRAFGTDGTVIGIEGSDKRSDRARAKFTKPALYWVRLARGVVETFYELPALARFIKSLPARRRVIVERATCNNGVSYRTVSKVKFFTK